MTRKGRFLNYTTISFLIYADVILLLIILAFISEGRADNLPETPHEKIRNISGKLLGSNTSPVSLKRKNKTSTILPDMPLKTGEIVLIRAESRKREQDSIFREEKETGNVVTLSPGKTFHEEQDVTVKKMTADGTKENCVSAAYGTYPSRVPRFSESSQTHSGNRTADGGSSPGLSPAVNQTGNIYGEGNHRTGNGIPAPGPGQTREVLIREGGRTAEVIAGESGVGKVPGRRKKPITIDGDRLLMQGSDTFVVLGNVVAREGERTIYTARGTYNEKTGLVKAIGDIRVVDPKFTMTCDAIDSHSRENFSIFDGNVKIVGENVIAEAKKGHYYEREEKLVLFGNPVARSRSENPDTVMGDRITYYFKNSSALVEGNCSATIQPKKGSESTEPVYITANILKILPDGRYQAEENIKAIRGSTTLTADRAIYDDTHEITEAFGNVVVTNPKYTLYAGYLKSYAKEKRTIAHENPSLVQITSKKSRAGEVSKNGRQNNDRNVKEEAEDGRPAGKGNPGEIRPVLPPSGPVLDGTEGLLFGGQKSTNRSRKAKGEGNVESTKKDKITLKANEIEALEDGDYVIARGKVFLVQEPYLPEGVTGEVEVSTVKCDVMDIFPNSGKSVAKGHVVMETSNILATGDKAVYFEDEGKLIITGNAKAVQKRSKGQEPNVVVGERILYYANTDRAVVEKARASVYSRKDEELPEIKEETTAVRLRRMPPLSGTSEGILKSAGPRQDGRKSPVTGDTDAIQINNTSNNIRDMDYGGVSVESGVTGTGDETSQQPKGLFAPLKKSGGTR